MPTDAEGEGTSESEPGRLVVLCRYRDLHEALMAKGTLDSAGIESFMAGENMVMMDWIWSNGIGGIRLFVREEDASKGADLRTLKSLRAIKTRNEPVVVPRHRPAPTRHLRSA